MIRADADALRGQIMLRKAEIREKELVFFLNNLNTISATSAVIAGFSFSSLVTTSLPDREFSRGLKLSYFLFQALSMILELVALLNANLCAIFGEELALRGPENGMENAVLGLQKENKIIIWYFRMGIACFMIAGTLWMWIALDIEVAICNTILMIMFMFFFFYHNNKIQTRFKMDEGFGGHISRFDDHHTIVQLQQVISSSSSFNNNVDNHGRSKLKDQKVPLLSYYDR